MMVVLALSSRLLPMIRVEPVMVESEAPVAVEKVYWLAVWAFTRIAKKKTLYTDKIIRVRTKQYEPDFPEGKRDMWE